MSKSFQIDDTMASLNTINNYGFSAVKLDELGASEYTLVTIAVDTSSSLTGYDNELETMLKSAVEACQKSPESENLMIRVVTFASNEEEMHGFKLLSTIKLEDYNGKIDTSGMTKLYDTVHHSIDAMSEYADKLIEQEFLVNGIVFVITDGMDNRSNSTPSMLKELIDKSKKKDETFESLVTVLIGMTDAYDVKDYLDQYKTEGGFTDYFNSGEVSKNTLAKIAGFISNSVSSTVNALGTGAPSKSITF